MSVLDIFQKFEEDQNCLEKTRDERFQRIKGFLKSTEKEAKAAKNSKRPFTLNKENVLSVLGYSKSDIPNSILICNKKEGSFTQNSQELTRGKRAKKKAMETLNGKSEQELENSKLPIEDQTKVIQTNPSPTPGCSKTDVEESEEKKNKIINMEVDEDNETVTVNAEENDLVTTSENCDNNMLQVIHCGEAIPVSTSQENPEVQIKTDQTDEIENNPTLTLPPVEDPVEIINGSEDKEKDLQQKEEEAPNKIEVSDSDNTTPSQESLNQNLAGKTGGTPEKPITAPTSGNAKSAIPIFKKARIEKLKTTSRCNGEFNKENATPLQPTKRLLQATPVNKIPKQVSSASKSLDKQKFALLDAEQRRKKEEEMKKKQQKVEEASKIKEEIIKSKTEFIRRTREEKQQKVFATREAVEREKQEYLLKLEKKKKEKEGQIKAKVEKLKEEQILNKKQLYLQKLQEVEDRRQREENARIARLKEQEEEQRRQTELKLRQQQEAEKLQQQRRLEEEARAKNVIKPVKPTAEKIKTTQNKVGNNNSYQVTSNNQKKPMISVDEDNYDIEDLQLDESDDEEHPRKMIPEWAKKTSRNKKLKMLSYIPMSIVSSFFLIPHKTPDMRKMFGQYAHTRERTSSAVWLNPPNTE